SEEPSQHDHYCNDTNKNANDADTCEKGDVKHTCTQQKHDECNDSATCPKGLKTSLSAAMAAYLKDEPSHPISVEYLLPIVSMPSSSKQVFCARKLGMIAERLAGSTCHVSFLNAPFFTYSQSDKLPLILYAASSSTKQ
ncbi:hypothetical protein HJC23_011343, partial [Cyclotella cryptica]